MTTTLRRWSCFSVILVASPALGAEQKKPPVEAPPPSAFETWAKPLDDVHRALPVEAPKVLELDKQVAALRQRRMAARDAAAAAEREAKAAVTRAKEAERAYARAPKASADPKLLGTARTEYQSARGHWSTVQKQLEAINKLEAELAVKAEAATALVTQAKALKATPAQGKPELTKARRQGTERAVAVADAAKAALRRTGYERAGSFEESLQKQQKVSADLATQILEAKQSVRDVRILLKKLEQAPAPEASAKPGDAPATKPTVTSATKPQVAPTTKSNGQGAAK
jgi:hypothetical protein